ncbi:MAG: thioredoxin family protein [Gammaproteobacteria bacterium]|jgi:predicted thioredoxin/glutaredoxin|nr:MAG: thioredoxin family protein [Gammaproteobacteria bacterium]
MNTKAVFYHAGCPVCIDAEHQLINSLKNSVESVHLGLQKNRLDEAIKAGVKSVPALVLDGNVFHINYGAGIEALANT